MPADLVLESAQVASGANAAVTVANGAQVTANTITGGDLVYKGIIGFTTSATPAAGVQVTVTLPENMPSIGATPFIVVLNQLDSNATVSFIATQSTVNSFKISAVAAPAATTTYSVGYYILL